MSGETEADPSGWTPDQLAQHFNRILAQMDHRYEQRFIAQEKAVHDAFVASEKAVQAALHSAEKAVEKALASNDRRLEAMNEFRASLSDLQATLITRREAQAMIDGMSNRVDDLKERSDQGQGKDTGGDHVWAMLFATIATVGTLADGITPVWFLIGTDTPINPDNGQAGVTRTWQTENFAILEAAP